MELEKLEVYQIARELSSLAWQIYNGLNKEHKFSIGSQFLEAVDSVGANIAEGYGRYHYMDSVKFYYTARGSLWESKHWIDLLSERTLAPEYLCSAMSEKVQVLGLKLNNFISILKSKAKQ